jgi:hypothetical protein
MFLDVRFEVVTAVTVKNAVFCDVAQDLHGATSQKTAFFMLLVV